jgi:hypothetical protein
VKTWSHSQYQALGLYFAASSSLPSFMPVELVTVYHLEQQPQAEMMYLKQKNYLYL